MEDRTSNFYNITHRVALDENGERHWIGDITKENRRKHKYFCLGCGDEMKANLCGHGIQSYFSHKSEGWEGKCSPETALHRFAKKELVDRFSKQDKFEVSYYVNNACPLQNTCRISKVAMANCSGRQLRTFDLKKLYDTCEEEGLCDGFKADVLLTSKQNSDTPPLFLEVFYSNDCTEAKINSGHPIIEITVRNEEDVAKPIKETVDEEEAPIKFYNFERETHFSDALMMDRFVLLKNGKKGAIRKCVVCGDMENKHIQGTIFELNVINEDYLYGPKPKHNLFALGISAAIMHGIPVRHCNFCQNIYYHCPVRSVEYDKKDKCAIAARCKHWHLYADKCRSILEESAGKFFIWMSEYPSK